MAPRALQTTGQTRELAAADDNNPYKGLERSLSSRIAGLRDALPKHIDPAKFQRTVMTAAQANPDLLTADRATLITACMKCAQDGLLPDGREAALVIYSTRQKQGSDWVSVKTVQYLPMVYGLRKKILQSGEISTLETNVVYRAEVESGAFIFEAGTEAMLRHRPMLDLDDDQITDDCIVAAYSVATMKDGSKSFEVMRRSEINKVRQASQTGALGKTRYNSKDVIPPKGPWVDWFSEMARKTVMRRHSKTLPMSGDLIDMEGTDEEAAARSASRLLEAQPDAPALAPPTRDEVAAGDPPHDAETGEITEEVERQLDADQGEGPAETDRGEAHNDTLADHPARATADDLVSRCINAAILGDVLIVETEFARHREFMPEELVGEVEGAIGEAKARFA